MSQQVKRGRGRPAIFVGNVERVLVRVLRKYGLTKGQAYLRKIGVQVKPGQGRRKIKVSLPTLSKLATRNGVTFHRGRPTVAA